MKKFLAIVCLLFTASAACAQSLPNFNIQRRCWNLGMRPNVPTQTIYYSCIAAEQAAYAQLYHWWDEIGNETRYRCLNAAGGSYANLQLCIDSNVGVSE